MYMFHRFHFFVRSNVVSYRSNSGATPLYFLDGVGWGGCHQHSRLKKIKKRLKKVLTIKITYDTITYQEKKLIKKRCYNVIINTISYCFNYELLLNDRHINWSFKIKTIPMGYVYNYT